MKLHDTIGTADGKAVPPSPLGTARGAAPPIDPEPDAVAWHARAEDLSRWAMARLVNRTDRCVRYFVNPDGVRQVADPPRAEDARDGLLDLARLVRHFRATGPDDVVAAYSYGRDKTGKWVGIDIDRHDDKADPEATADTPSASPPPPATSGSGRWSTAATATAGYTSG